MSTSNTIGSPEPVRVMHMLHELEIAPTDMGSTVRLGFKWAEWAQRANWFRLCVCSDRCTDPGMCGTEDYEAVKSRSKFRQSEGRASLLGAWVCDNCEIQGVGRVDRVWVGRFRDVPAYLLSFEHERRSREYWGLFDSMRKAYGNSFSENSFVTVLLYTRES